MYLLDIEKFKKLLEENENTLDASTMKGYMKDHFDFYGIKSVERKLYFSKCLYQSNEATNIQELQNQLDQLWDEPKREMQYAAMELLDKSKKNLDQDWLTFIEKMVISKSWWDTVDHIASHYLGHILKNQDYNTQWATCENWIETENLWLQRCAIIYQLKYKDSTNFEILKNSIWATIHNKNFFIRKASGWALREYSKSKPYEVKLFITEYGEVLDKLTIKEASKYL
jgi:3-methyladenine DNA glycosylase AlkD